MGVFGVIGLMKEHLTEGGWEDYIRKIKSQLDNLPTKEQYSSMMRMYLDRVNVDDAVLSLKSSALKREAK